MTSWVLLNLQEAAADADTPSSPPAGVAHDEEGPATAGAGITNGAPPLNALQQQWAPEPEEEEEEEEEEENIGQWSPAPLDAHHIGNQDVVHEDDDQRLLDLLRKQVSIGCAVIVKSQPIPALGIISLKFHCFSVPARLLPCVWHSSAQNMRFVSLTGGMRLITVFANGMIR